MPKTRFQNLLEQRIEEAVHKIALSIATTACPDYPSYREQTGYIRGLYDALNLANDIEKESE